MSKYPKAKVTVFVLWTPWLRSDTQAAAQRATVYLRDSRAQHFWDLWKFGSRTYSEQLKTPLTESWDLFVVYKPYIYWRDTAPEPTDWMQNRNLPQGTHYSKELLEKSLADWLN